MSGIFGVGRVVLISGSACRVPWYTKRTRATNNCQKNATSADSPSFRFRLVPHLFLKGNGVGTPPEPKGNEMGTGPERRELKGNERGLARNEKGTKRKRKGNGGGTKRELKGKEQETSPERKGNQTAWYSERQGACLSKPKRGARFFQKPPGHMELFR